MTDAAARWTALLDAMDEGLGASPPVLLDAVPGDQILLMIGEDLKDQPLHALRCRGL